jgi:hypothetical protein
MSNTPFERQQADARRGESQSGPTRRDVIAGAALATGIAAAGLPARAQGLDPGSSRDMVAFIVLSWVLTGISPRSLAPGFKIPAPNADLLLVNPGNDPVNIKREYFNWINDRQAPTFERLLRIVRDSRTSANLAETILQKVKADEEAKYLARSIVLLWYLGSWYEPADLRKASEDLRKDPANFTKDRAKGAFIRSTVVSAKAYTQGWIWQIAQAHPMGYSDLQFGYWNRDPFDPNVFDPKDPKTGPLGFLTKTLA